MALAYKHECENCKVVLRKDGEAYICAHECTFCAACAARMSHTCPNCGGELVRRPRWKTSATVEAGRSCEVAS